MSLVGDMEEVSERLDEQSEALKAILEGNRQSRANVEQVLNRPSVRWSPHACAYLDNLGEARPHTHHVRGMLPLTSDLPRMKDMQYPQQ